MLRKDVLTLEGGGLSDYGKLLGTKRCPLCLGRVEEGMSGVSGPENARGHAHDIQRHDLSTEIGHRVLDSVTSAWAGAAPEWVANGGAIPNHDEDVTIGRR